MGAAHDRCVLPFRACSNSHDCCLMRADNPQCELAGCGEWRRPMKSNPKYKGKWIVPMIDNPEYKGVWKARQIANPDYFQDLTPHKMAPMGAVGIEIWSATLLPTVFELWPPSSRSLSSAADRLFGLCCLPGSTGRCRTRSSSTTC